MSLQTVLSDCCHFNPTGFSRCGVSDVGNAFSPALHRLGRLLELFTRLDLHGHQHLGDFIFHAVQQLAKEFKRFTFVLLFRLLLSVAPQVNALPQVVQCAQVFTPVGVNTLQQHHPLELNEVFFTDGINLGVKSRMGCSHHLFNHFIVGDGCGGIQLGRQRQIDLPFVPQHLLQTSHIPLLFHAFRWHILARQVSEAAFPQRGNLARQVVGVHDVIALLVDHLALVVGNVVVLQQLLAHIKVAGFHLPLGRFDTAGHDSRFDGFAIGHFEPLHDGLDAIACENTHQRVVEAQVEP